MAWILILGALGLGIAIGAGITSMDITPPKEPHKSVADVMRGGVR